MNTPKSDILVVDLDDTLVKTDLLHEGLLSLLKTSPASIPGLIFAGFKGRVSLKRYVSSRTTLNPASLPYNPEVVSRIELARKNQESVILASASPRSYVETVGKHLGLFDACHWSDEINLKGRNKLKLLDELYGKSNLKYIGDSSADIPIWREVKGGAAVSSSAQLKRKLQKVNQSVEWIDRQKPSIKTILKQLRWHQWSKNLLLFVPIIMSHQIHDMSAWLSGLIAFVAFSSLASSVYVLNDMLDIEADRLHQTKKNRPFASGELPIRYGFLLIPLGLGFACLAAMTLPLGFANILCLYLLINLAYSFKLKKTHSLDIVLLASMYTLRIFAGGIATGIAVSEWLLSFSTFFFFGLAVVKRYTECSNESKEAIQGSGRGYLQGDREILLGLGVSSSLLSCVILALYFNNPQIAALYSHPERLWLILPVILFWITRLWILTRRGEIDADPVSYALKDSTSYFTLVLTLALLYFAI